MATQEILHFENMKEVQNVGVSEDEILFCLCRIMEGQELRAVDCLSETLDIESFTGIKFCVPLLSRQPTCCLLGNELPLQRDPPQGCGVHHQAGLVVRQDSAR